jgi:uncharacterized metal-binding protein
MPEEKDACCCGGIKALILACSGGSNVGQVSNNVMVELDKKGIGSAYCLAGVGADLSGFIESSKAAQTILIDGCPIACGRKIFEKHGIEPAKYFVITEFGIEKKHAYEKLGEETNRALDCVMSNIQRGPSCC